MTKTLKEHPYAQATVREYKDGTVELISYTTTVITINQQGWITCTGLYSMTTRKHIKYFAKEYGFSYQLVKELVENGKAYNLNTGEYIDWV